jgi:hypothetical protein
MGQTNSKDTETINWNKIQTNDMSSTIPNINGISYEANELISRINNIAEISDNESEFSVGKIFKVNDNNVVDDETTSPFISSEMYNYLVNKKSGMIGGAKKEDDLDTSDTSDEDFSDKKKKTSESKHSKKDSDDESHKGKIFQGKRKNKSKASDSYLTYISSSAHTGGSVTDTIKNENSYTISSVNTSDINIISEN